MDLAKRVLCMVRAFEEASCLAVPYQITPRGPGDIAVCYADHTKLALERGWNGRFGLPQMMRDACLWQSINPNGHH